MFDVFALIDASREELPPTWYIALGTFRLEFERLYKIESAALSILNEVDKYTQPTMDQESSWIKLLADACDYELPNQVIIPADAQ